VLEPAGHPARVFAVAFGPDGRTLLTGSDDSTVLMWNLRPRTELKHAGDMARLWADLAESDAAAAYKAIWQLADRPELTVPFLKTRLTPAKPVDRERLRKSLELSRAPSAEKHSRLQTLLQAAAGQGSAEDARQARAVIVLKWAKTPEALQLLRDLAGGAAHARLTLEARAALKHLDSDQKSFPK
jgi:WD domain, G-beta repeat